MSVLTTRRATITSAAAVAALLVAPSVSDAATTFGSLRTTNDPNQPSCFGLGACTIISYINPVDPNGDPYSGGAPVSGVITKVRIRAYGNGGPATVGFRVASLNPAADFLSAIGTAGAVGATVTVPVGSGGTTPTTEVNANIPVAAGQHLAVDGSPNLVATYDSSGSKFSYVFAPPLVSGQARGSSTTAGELLASATIEPYALTGLKVSGGKVSYSLNAPSTVKIALAKGSKGRKVNSKCVRQTKKNRNKKRCTYYKRVKTISGSGKVGTNKVKLPKLRSGKYQLTLTATDTAGNKTVKVKTFTVKKSRKK